MRVLKKGNSPGWSMTAKCTGSGNGDGGCGAKLSVTADDLYHTYRSYYDGSDDRFTTFMCPDCGVETDVAEAGIFSKIPYRISSHLPNKDAWLRRNENRKPDTILTVDAIVTVAGEDVVLIRRAKPPFEDKLVLPGGHVEENETLAVACVRELEEEIGLKVEENELRLVTVLDARGRDPRPGRRVSAVFRLDVSRERAATIHAGSDAREIVTRPIASLRSEEMGFDHARAIERLS